MRFGPGYFIYGIVALGVSTYFLMGHVVHASKGTNLALCYAFMWTHLALKMVCSLKARPHVVRPGAQLDRLSVDVVVPAYNEDPALLAAGVASIARQTRPPRVLWLVDDGSTRDGQDLLVLREPEVVEAIRTVEAQGIWVECLRQPNQGKRHAQANAFHRSDADVFITLDSDTVLKADAVEKLLVPFSRPDVMCVGGTACGQNANQNLFTRMVEMNFVMAFIQGRMAEGAFGSVRVNCGILAAYRGDVVRQNLHRFLNQRFLGRPVRAGDDRMLTLFCKERGRAEYQPEAVAYSALPARLNHLVRQRLRWCRSFCWGTLWLLRRPLNSADFWFTFTQVLALTMFGISAGAALVGTLTGAVHPDLITSTTLTAAAIGFVSHFRYVLIARPGEPLYQRLLTWLVSPLTSLLSFVVLTPLYFVAIASPRPQKTWGTRKKVEVGLHTGGAGGVAPAAVARPALNPSSNG